MHICIHICSSARIEAQHITEIYQKKSLIPSLVRPHQTFLSPAEGGYSLCSHSHTVTLSKNGKRSDVLPPHRLSNFWGWCVALASSWTYGAESCAGHARCSFNVLIKWTCIAATQFAWAIVQSKSAKKKPLISGFDSGFSSSRGKSGMHLYPPTFELLSES